MTPSAGPGPVWRAPQTAEPSRPDANDLTGLAAAWRANLDANLLSAVLMTAALAPRLELDARIVTLGSIAARRGPGPTGRPGDTADVAAAVTFLASPAAGHITGQIIHVNGGAYLGR